MMMIMMVVTCYAGTRSAMWRWRRLCE